MSKRTSNKKSKDRKTPIRSVKKVSKHTLHYRAWRHFKRLFK